MRMENPLVGVGSEVPRQSKTPTLQATLGRQLGRGIHESTN